MNDLQKNVFRHALENRRQQALDLLQRMKDNEANGDRSPATGAPPATSPMQFGLKQLVRDIDTALDKVKDNTIGVCMQCGDEISAERLLAFPATKYCFCCQALQGDADNSQWPYTLWKYTT